MASRFLRFLLSHSYVLSFASWHIPRTHTHMLPDRYDRLGWKRTARSLQRDETLGDKIQLWATYLPSQTLITPSSPGISTAAFTSSLLPSSLLSSSGFLVVLKRSFALRGAGLISAAIQTTVRKKGEIRKNPPDASACLHYYWVEAATQTVYAPAAEGCDKHRGWGDKTSLSLYATNYDGERTLTVVVLVALDDDDDVWWPSVGMTFAVRGLLSCFSFPSSHFLLPLFSLSLTANDVCDLDQNTGSVLPWRSRLPFLDPLFNPLFTTPE